MNGHSAPSWPRKPDWVILQDVHRKFIVHYRSYERNPIDDLRQQVIDGVGLNWIHLPISF